VRETDPRVRDRFVAGAIAEGGARNWGIAAVDDAWEMIPHRYGSFVSLLATSVVMSCIVSVQPLVSGFDD
jgi:hypothetical protein